MFQSSPDPKAGCYLVPIILIDVIVDVSILTRPEGRVLQSRHFKSIAV